VAAQAAGNGTIYQAATYRPLFEDRRARFVGDLVTITIEEKTQAAKQASSNGAKNGSADASISSIARLPLKALQGLGITASTKIQNDDKSAANSSNSFSGSVTVTVIEVLANGNLLVAGEKQIALDKGTEFIRLSGIVQPDTLLAGNTVSSARVADARIEYRTSANFDQAELMNWLGRFFLSILPL
jgi:flagellar L-ring protein precursor FlgH